MKLPHEFLLHQLGFEAWAFNIIYNCQGIDPSVACLEWQERGVEVTYRDGTWTVRAHDGSGWKTYQHTFGVPKAGCGLVGPQGGSGKAKGAQLRVPSAGRCR